MSLEKAVHEKDLVVKVPSPDVRNVNVSNYMEANNIIKEEDEGDSEATSMRGTGKGGKSTEMIEIENMLN